MSSVSLCYFSEFRIIKLKIDIFNFSNLQKIHNFHKHFFKSFRNIVYIYLAIFILKNSHKIAPYTHLINNKFLKEFSANDVGVEFYYLFPLNLFISNSFPLNHMFY